jgi:hypothetical protein
MAKLNKVEKDLLDQLVKKKVGDAAALFCSFSLPPSSCAKERH